MPLAVFLLWGLLTVEEGVSLPLSLWRLLSCYLCGDGLWDFPDRSVSECGIKEAKGV